LNVQKAVPLVTWPAPAAITYGTPLGAAQLNATASVPGTFSYTPSAGTRLAAGSGIALSATFVPADSANYVAATTNRSIDVLRAPLAISAVNTSKIFGAPLPAFGAVGSGFVNGDSIASLSGTLTFGSTATATSPVGTYAVTPGGLSSANYSITFVAGVLTVTQASSVAALGSSASPSGFDQAVTFNASVSIAAPGAGTPSGTIEFRDGSTRLGTVALTNGSASLTTNGLSASSHTISAIYSGDANVGASAQSFTQTILTSAQSSTTALSSSSNPATSGASVTLTATVTAPAGLSDNVVFYDGSNSIGTAPLSGAKAKLVIATLANGTHAITARYLGNATIPPSISPVFAQIIKPSGTTLRNSTATVVASPSTGTLDQAVTFTATVSGNQSTPPTGAVIFFVDGFVVSGPVTLSPSGNATARGVFTTSTLAHGVHDVTVAYLGDGTYKGDTGTTTLTVN
jgi:MBG domain-containing protein/Big-like domain-containing protein